MREEQDLAIVLVEWRTVLEYDVAADDNFFAAGGDSLKAVDVVSRLHERLALPLDYLDVFDHPTPATFAALVTRLRQGDR
jgi:acyl carrier protein